MRLRLIAVLALALAAPACGSSTPTQLAPDAAAPGGSASGAAAVKPTASSKSGLKAAVRQGSVIARSLDEHALYIADEDHSVLRVVSLPLTDPPSVIVVGMPGPPANIVVLGERVLVTVRSPGFLLAMRPDPTAGLVETDRVPLPADAWGIGVTPDEKLALVTSSWTHQVTAVALGPPVLGDGGASTVKPLWTRSVGREPRAVVVRPDGMSAYVTHLVGPDLTRLDAITLEATTRVVSLPAGPSRAPSGVRLDASLAYAAVLSDDGTRLFVPRHALGAMGHNAWFGAATVDVLLTSTDTPLAPAHQGKLPLEKSALAAQVMQTGSDLGLPGGPLAPFTQPRAVAYRKSNHSLVVVGEGDDLLAELDATSLDPTLALLRTYKVGQDYDPNLPVAGRCGAPAGLALSGDEKTAWVFCRATYDVAAVRLDPAIDPAAVAPKPSAVDAGAPAAAGSAAKVPPGDAAAPVASAAPSEDPGTKPAAEAPALTVIRLADDPLGKEAASGRRLFYNATDPMMSGGLACAGCHPEGRDDGHVWHEAKLTTADGEGTNFLGATENLPAEARTKGVPRRTAMLAGRVDAAGPYGWHGESADLAARLVAGFGLHRWGGIPKHEQANLDARAGLLVPFLRRGLVTPRSDAAELTSLESRGKSVFLSAETQCARCHVPQPEYTDRALYPLKKLPPRPGFDDEARLDFRTPSLRSVGQRAPYYHDGRATSLEDLVDQNLDRMGKTVQLNKDDRAALVAFLRTL